MNTSTWHCRPDKSLAARPSGSHKHQKTSSPFALSSPLPPLLPFPHFHVLAGRRHSHARHTLFWHPLPLKSTHREREREGGEALSHPHTLLGNKLFMWLPLPSVSFTIIWPLLLTRLLSDFSAWEQQRQRWKQRWQQHAWNWNVAHSSIKCRMLHIHEYSYAHKCDYTSAWPCLVRVWVALAPHSHFHCARHCVPCSFPAIPQDEQCSPKLSSNNNKTTSRLPAAHLNSFTMSELKL